MSEPEAGSQSGITLRDGVAVRHHRPPRRDRASTVPLIFYLHGLGESSECFEALLKHPRLAGFEQVAIDLPGYGHSRRSNSGAASLDHLAELVAGWIEAELDAPTLIVGHSMGGVLGQLICGLEGRHRRHLAGLLNVEGNLSPGDCTASAVAAADHVDDFVSRGFARLVESLEQLGQNDPAHRGYARHMRRCQPLQFHLNARELVELSQSEQLPARLAALQLPVRYLGGRPGGVADRSLELLELTHVDTVIVEPSGHWPYIDQPERFVDLLLDFVAELRPIPTPRDPGARLPPD